ncbi:MAG TPA: phytoene desaturase family protein, partial [Clostridia bacterium]|nr:phytoene desaturase family protein [Clostridia bacterium]
FDDGSTLDLTADLREMCTRLDQFAPGRSVSPGYRRLLALSERLHDISNRYFFYRPIEGIRDMFNARETFKGGTLKDVMAMRMGGTVGGTIRAHVPDERVAQMLDHFTQYVGSAPDASPAVLCGIAHMQTSEGVWYPLGGTGAVPQALSRLAGELGVQFHTETSIRRILTEHGAVCGVETDKGERIELSAVISNMDAVRTHRELIGGEAARRFEGRRKYEPACSGVVLYLGLKQRYDHLAHHNFVFSRSHEEEFDHIYRRGEPAPDPTCYLCAPSRTEPQVAPAGGEALYILVHTPYLRSHHDWRKMLPGYRETIFQKLARTAGMEDLPERIAFQRVLTPQDIHDRYRVLNGAIYGLSSHGRFFGAFKPNNRSPEVRGLYLAGGAAHPGPGMPMVMMSGWIAADALDKDGNCETALEQNPQGTTVPEAQAA